MKIVSKSMGKPQTNCNIVSLSDGDIIIDPGIDALPWIEKNHRQL